MQSAYKPFYNTETLLLNLTNYISKYIKNNRFVILILLDLTAAFDMHKQCNCKIFKIKQIKHLLNPTSLKILTSAYILSKLDYCNSLLINIPKIQEKRQQNY